MACRYGAGRRTAGRRGDAEAVSTRCTGPGRARPAVPPTSHSGPRGYRPSNAGLAAAVLVARNNGLTDTATPTAQRNDLDPLSPTSINALPAVRLTDEPLGVFS